MPSLVESRRVKVEVQVGALLVSTFRRYLERLTLEDRLVRYTTADGFMETSFFLRGLDYGAWLDIQRWIKSLG